MSNKRTPQAEPVPETITANDAYANPAAGLGFGAESLAEGIEYPMTRLTMQYMLLLSLYRSSGILKRIVNKPVEDAVAHWYTLKSQLKPGQLEMLSRLEKKTKVKKNIEKGQKLARLFGGAAGLIMIDGQGDMLDQPLDLDTIEPDSFKGIYVVDRWSGVYPSTSTVDDIGDPEFGEPEYYEVRVSENSTADVRVHHSRIVRFMGEELPYWESLIEQGWGASVIETVFDELKMYDDVRFNIARLIYQANVWVQKSDDLAQALSLSPNAAQNRLYQTLHAQSTLQSSFRTRIIGKDDDLQNHQYTFSGLDSVFEVYMYALSSVSGIPITILFGRSPGGLNATGDADMDNYYTMLEGIQENKLLPVIEKLLPIMCMSEFGAVPDDLDVLFTPVRVPSEKEKAEIASELITAVMAPYDAGVTGRKTTLKELRQIAEKTDVFSNITDEDIEAADDMPVPGDVPELQGDDQPSIPPDAVQRITEITAELTRIHGKDQWNEDDHPRADNGEFGNGDDGNQKENIDKLSKKDYSDILTEVKVKNGITVKGIYPHMYRQAVKRGISPETIKDVLMNYTIDYPGNDKGKNRHVYVKDGYRVVIDFDDEEIVTVVDEQEGKR